MTLLLPALCQSSQLAALLPGGDKYVTLKDLKFKPLPAWTEAIQREYRMLDIGNANRAHIPALLAYAKQCRIQAVWDKWEKAAA